VCLGCGPGLRFVDRQPQKEKKVIKNLDQGYKAKRVKKQLPPMGKIHSAKITVISNNIIDF
jgi:hypothetical protein